jgi:phospholipid/cholesterol/gamma-HCH transport system permease protein
VAFLGHRIIVVGETIGSFLLFLNVVVRLCFEKPFRSHLLFQQLHFIGNQSLNIILLTGFFTGGVFGLQLGVVFDVFRAEGMMGGATAKALTRELAPLMTGFLLAGRAGSSMTAEIATMKVNEQIDALEAMGIDPLHYLIVPRFLASILIIPLLCGIFILIGVVGCWAVAVGIYNADQGTFFEKMVWLMETEDIWAGLFKALIFAGIISVVACSYGISTNGGAKGVGSSTTMSVVNMLLLILASDVVITYFQIVLLK